MRGKGKASFRTNLSYSKIRPKGKILNKRKRKTALFFFLGKEKLRQKKPMQTQLSKAPRGTFGIVGHVGCGHANSHCGFIQDDSGGFAAVTRILERATGLDLTISEVRPTVGKNGGFEVVLASGGRAYASARRGVTAFEAELSQRVVGLSAVTTQADAMKAFGRVLGQGALEVPVALQTAIANAAVDSFAKNFPDAIRTGEEDVPGNIGRWLACVLNVDGIDVSVMALINATAGGLGPNEDVEGNVNLAGKASVMHDLGLDAMPTILLEGKVCAEPVSSKISEPTFVTRAYAGDDNVTVSECLEASARELGYPIVFPRELLARKKGAMRSLTQEMGEHIAQLGEELARATTSAEKVRLAAEINRYASEDLGGVTFMSDDIHEVMGGVGAIPGTTGCLSLFISNAEVEKTVYPALTHADVDRFADVVLNAVAILNARKADAYAEVKAASSRAQGHGLKIKA